MPLVGAEEIVLISARPMRRPRHRLSATHWVQRQQNRQLLSSSIYLHYNFLEMGLFFHSLRLTNSRHGIEPRLHARQNKSEGQRARQRQVLFHRTYSWLASGGHSSSRQKQRQAARVTKSPAEWVNAARARNRRVSQYSVFRRSHRRKHRDRYSIR